MVLNDFLAKRLHSFFYVRGTKEPSWIVFKTDTDFDSILERWPSNRQPDKLSTCRSLYNNIFKKLLPREMLLYLKGWINAKRDENK